MRIRDFLMEKAMKPRDLSKLVQVKRTVSRGGKTFTQMYWVKPSQVKKTDQVVGGQKNVQGTGQQPAPSNNKNTAPSNNSSFDKAQFDSLAKTDRSKAMDYLKSCGVTWKENAHAGINWMRAMQAVKKAGSQPQPAQKQNQPASQPTQNQSQTAQSQQTSVSGAQLDSKVQAALQNCNTGKDCVATLKQHLGPDGCMDYARKLGVTWKESTHPGINQMRMSMALNKHFTNNLPKNNTQSQQATQPQQTTTNKDDNKPKGKVGAPKGNQNAKKDGVKDDDTKKDDKKKEEPKKPEPKAKPDELEVPDSATQRQKNIINLINKVTDVNELKSYTAIGMIPEDDTAKSFMLEKLVPKYATWAAEYGISSDIDPETGATGVVRLASKLARDTGADVPSEVGIGTAYNLFSEKFKTHHITVPRNLVRTALGPSTHETDIDDRDEETPTMTNLLCDIRNAYSTNASNENKDSNVGYNGWDSSKCKDTWKEENDGFIKSLNRMSEKDPSLKDETDKMIGEYKKIMEKVGYNGKLLERVLDAYWWWSEGVYEVKDEPNKGAYSASEYKLQAAHVNRLAKIIPKLLKENYGLSPKAILTTMEKNIYLLYNNRESKHNLSKFNLYDENGKHTSTINLGEEKEKNKWVVFSSWSTRPESRNDKWTPPFAEPWMVAAAMEIYRKDTPALKNVDYSSDRTKYEVEGGIENLAKAEAIGSISKRDWASIQASAMNMLGIGLRQYKTPGEFLDDKHTAKLKAKPATASAIINKRKYVMTTTGSSSKNPKLDCILANLNMMCLSHYANSKASSALMSGSKPNSTGHFSYYSDTSIEKPKTASGINEKVNSQLEFAPFLSSQYCGELVKTMGTDSNTDKHLNDEFINNPLKNVVYETLKSATSNIPSMAGDGGDKKLAESLNYVPYDFSLGRNKQPKLREDNTEENSDNSSELRKARETALRAINCSVATEDEKASEAMRKDFLDRWDYKGGEKCPDGIVRGTTYTRGNKFKNGDRRALFNSRFFKVNNSNMQETFGKYKEELKDAPKHRTQEMELFSAMSYASCAGILGKSGGWLMGKQFSKVGQALGNGAYFGYRGGKSVPYCGEMQGGYGGVKREGTHGDNANGCYILSSCIRGKRGDSTSDHGQFHDFEICFHTNKVIKPHHFVDISVRTLGTNVERDKDGNYMADDSGKITHDKNGVAINMK